MNGTPKKEKGDPNREAAPSGHQFPKGKSNKKSDAVATDIQKHDAELDDKQDGSIKTKTELNRIAEILKESKLDLSKEIPEPEHLMCINDVGLFSRGDFSIVTGLAKSRKTWFCLLMVSKFLTENPKGKVLWSDTEQSENWVALLGRRLNVMMGRSENDPLGENIDIRVFRPYSTQEVHDATFILIEEKKPDLVIVDGLADLLPSVNKEEDAVQLIRDVMGLASRYRCHIICVIHLNQKMESNSPRGWLGSESVRKLETTIRCTAEESNYTKVTFDNTKGKRPQDFSFEIVEINGTAIPRILDFDPKAESYRKKLSELFSQLLTHNPETQNKVLVQGVMKIEGVKEKTAQNRIKTAIELGVIVKAKNGLYQLPPIESQKELDL